MSDEARIAEIRAEIAERQRQIVDLWPTHKAREIAEIIGTTKSAVQAAGRRLGLRAADGPQ